MQAPLIGISRLRMGTDGHGVTTLVAFHGCPLRCKYCLNPQGLSDDAPVLKKTPEEVMQEIRKDELYYLATNGGVTFGGGEPFLRSEFIKEVLELGAKQWHIIIETSLNVPLQNLVLLFPCIHEYVVDIKDMNPCIYKEYNGRDNELVKSNLRWLIEHGKAENITCRIPLIPEFNTPEDQQRKMWERDAKTICLKDDGLILYMQSDKIPIEVKGMLAFTVQDFLYHAPMGGAKEAYEFAKVVGKHYNI